MVGLIQFGLCSTTDKKGTFLPGLNKTSDCYLVYSEARSRIIVAHILKHLSPQSASVAGREPVCLRGSVVEQGTTILWRETFRNALEGVP